MDLPADIIGAPYAFPPHPPETFDCWSLLVYVRDKLGLPTVVEVDPELYSSDTMQAAVEQERCNGRWQPVEGLPCDGDAVLFTHDHIGVFLGSGVLHAHRPNKGVLFTKWAVVKRRWPLVEVWRP